MKLNIAQCRSAKETVAHRGSRRSTRIRSLPASSCLQQQQIADLNAAPHCLALLPISTVSYRGKVHKARTCKRKEARRPVSLKIEALNQSNQTHDCAIDTELPSQDFCNGEDFAIAGHLARQNSSIHEKSSLYKQRSFEQASKVLPRQSSFSIDTASEAALRRQTSAKIEALIEPRALSRTNSCTTIGRKRVVGVDDFSQALELTNADSVSSLSSLAGHEFSPRKKFASLRTDSTCLDRSPSALLTLSELELLRQSSFSPPSPPSTPTSNSSFGWASSRRWATGDSLLEELPFDLLLRIVCCLKHDDLSAVSLACPRLSRAVSIAQDCHFSYTTPCRAKEGKTAQIYLSSDEQSARQGSLASTFIRPATPNAPKHRSTKPAELNFFEESPFESGASQLESPMADNTMKAFKTRNMSKRVLFDEDELCKAVAQNSL